MESRGALLMQFIMSLEENLANARRLADCTGLLLRMRGSGL